MWYYLSFVERGCWADVRFYLDVNLPRVHTSDCLICSFAWLLHHCPSSARPVQVQWGLLVLCQHNNSRQSCIQLWLKCVFGACLSFKSCHSLAQLCAVVYTRGQKHSCSLKFDLELRAEQYSFSLDKLGSMLCHEPSGSILTSDKKVISSNPLTVREQLLVLWARSCAKIRFCLMLVALEKSIC